MKKFVFAAILTSSVMAQAQFGGVNLPHLWWPEEFTAKNLVSAEEVKMVMTSKNVKAYLNQQGLGSVNDVVKTQDGIFVMTEGCTFNVVINTDKNPAVRPVQNSLYCD